MDQLLRRHQQESVQLLQTYLPLLRQGSDAMCALLLVRDAQPKQGDQLQVMLQALHRSLVCQSPLK